MYKCESDMKSAAEYVAYEWGMFSWAASMLERMRDEGEAIPDSWRVGTGGPDDEATWAMVEVLLLHTRVLRSFFSQRPSKTTYPADMFAEDFFDTTGQWTAPAFWYLTQHKVRLDRALAHLSYDRSSHKLIGGDWECDSIVAEISDAWTAFRDALPSERKAWFG